MPANQSWPPTEVERRQFGELADDIAFLRRGCGIMGAPFQDGYRLDDVVVFADGLQARAKRERARREPGRAATAVPSARPVEAPAPKPPPVEAAARAAQIDTELAGYVRRLIPAKAPTLGTMCKCGRPDSHQGRCWHRRGWTGPGQDPAAKPKAEPKPKGRPKRDDVAKLHELRDFMVQELDKLSERLKGVEAAIAAMQAPEAGR